ncbi:MAG: metallophosphoesterase [Erysipelotrichaceae bacterium]|nr:metallophosphoesterase [Erysipelotrichaceae bacterium]
MKKVVVMSDNHGDQEAIELIKEYEADADYFIHLGDSCSFDDRVLEGCIAIRGNNDWPLDHLPYKATIKIEGINILMAHGHQYGYYNREESMMYDLEEHECTVLLYGHTHAPVIDHIGDYYFINPGSTSLPRSAFGPSYAILTINGSHLDAEIVKFVRDEEEDEDSDDDSWFDIFKDLFF